MAVQNFAVELIEELLKDKDLALTEEDIRFYAKGTTAGPDEALDNHIRWKNARYFNEDSNLVRSSTLIIQFTVENGTEYLNFQVGELYRIYRKDGMKKVLSTVKSDIKGVKAMTARTMSLLNQFGDYSAIKDHLIVRPLNYDNNDKVLETGIYRQIGDMALVLYISLGTTTAGARPGSKNIISTMVLKEMFRLWEKDENEVFDWAMENTMRLQPPVFCHVSGKIGSMELKSKHVRFMDDESVKFDFDSPLAPTLSTEQEVNGAIAAFFPGVLERLYRMVGEDFYLVFTGIYDVHIHPVSGKKTLSGMRSSLDGMNRTANRRDELLSRKIYRYSGATKEIAVVS